MAASMACPTVDDLEVPKPEVGVLGQVGATGSPLPFPGSLPRTALPTSRFQGSYSLDVVFEPTLTLLPPVHTAERLFRASGMPKL